MAVTINGSTGIELEDNDKQIFGTGDDLQIYYSGSDGFIKQPVGTMWTETPAWCVTSATGSEYMARFDENGSCKLYYDNSAKIETISTGLNITGGVRLGGNNAANELDDYEEGTFTPKLAGNANNSTYNVTGSGFYTKIGNMCHVQVRFHGVDLDNSADGCVIITDMPFTGHNASTNPGCAAGTTGDFHTYNCVFASDQRYTWYLSHNTDWWQGLISRSNNTWADWDIDDFNVQSTLYMDFSGTYRTA